MKENWRIVDPRVLWKSTCGVNGVKADRAIMNPFMVWMDWRQTVLFWIYMWCEWSGSRLLLWICMWWEWSEGYFKYYIRVWMEWKQTVLLWIYMWWEWSEGRRVKRSGSRTVLLWIYICVNGVNADWYYGSTYVEA